MHNGLKGSRNTCICQNERVVWRVNVVSEHMSNLTVCITDHLNIDGMKPFTICPWTGVARYGMWVSGIHGNILYYKLGIR